MRLRDVGRHTVGLVPEAGFVGTTAESLTVISRCPKTGRAQAQQVRAATAMAAGPSTKVAINGFGRIGRNVLRCWLKRESKPFDIVASLASWNRSALSLCLAAR